MVDDASGGALPCPLPRAAPESAATLNPGGSGSRAHTSNTGVIKIFNYYFLIDL